MSTHVDLLREHCNITGSGDDPILERCLDAATSHLQRLLGYQIDDPIEFPEGTPADIALAILMLGAHYYENREATITGVSAMVIPFGVAEIVAENRRYTFG